MDSQTGDALSLFSHVRVGDRLRVRAGMGYHADGKEYYKSGDEGEIMKIVTDTQGSDKAVVRWARTRQSSVAPIASLHKRFVRITEGLARTVGMLVGSTSSGYVFALDMATGEEIWATKASDEIQGVKGAVSGRNGVVVAATNRCKDRYCYRYRNQTNPLTPSNTVVRGLSASDGSALWEFKPTSPVWNMVPMYSNDSTTVMFSDFEGSAYCLDLLTGELKWQHQGAMGTYTQSFAVYFGPGNLLYTMGLKNEGSWSYEHNFGGRRTATRSQHPVSCPGAALGRAPRGGSGRSTRAPAGCGGSTTSRRAARLGRLRRDAQGRPGHPARHHHGPQLPLQVTVQDPEPGPPSTADSCGRGTAPRCGPTSAPATRTAPTSAGPWAAGPPVSRRRGRRRPSTCTVTSTSAARSGSSRDGARTTARTATGRSRCSPPSPPGSRSRTRDLAITFAPGMMAVSTCTSLIVFSTVDGAPSMRRDGAPGKEARGAVRVLSERAPEGDAAPPVLPVLARELPEADLPAGARAAQGCTAGAHAENHPGGNARRESSLTTLGSEGHAMRRSPPALPACRAEVLAAACGRVRRCPVRGTTRPGEPADGAAAPHSGRACPLRAPARAGPSQGRERLDAALHPRGRSPCSDAGLRRAPFGPVAAQPPGALCAPGPLSRHVEAEVAWGHPLRVAEISCGKVPYRVCLLQRQPGSCQPRPGEGHPRPRLPRVALSSSPLSFCLAAPPPSANYACSAEPLVPVSRIGGP
ncbi:unnamed protein product [Prorocentrum cordatum]|uniref:Pyrrolo-quinoline quinone repeat domain-containing protein n=1 Tax=Prorocentrum cordatum TaxID=2364126 RepID=A0ABN9VWH1_9DINO|nr:unnamed protein product [Polarella glacialis]